MNTASDLTVLQKRFAEPALRKTSNGVGAAQALSLLSSMYLCKPSAETITAWSSLIANDNSPYLADLRGALEGIDVGSGTTMETLLWDFTRLFIGPYRLPCPPWESVYTSETRLLMQNAAIDAKRIYVERGVAIDESTAMPDHIGVELNFLALAFAGNCESNGQISSGTNLGARFLHDHLLNWVPQFTRDLEGSAQTILYQALARGTQQVLEAISAATKGVGLD